MEKGLKEKSSSALKWSSLGEIIAKIITPISNLILARLLTPEAFGVVATVTMLISFADTLSDSGFQKFLIQNEFKNSKDYNKSIKVAFTSNLIFSVLLWILIIIFNEKLATLVGNPGLGSIFIISGISLMITSFVSIYSAVLKRSFDFKKLFYARIANAVVPLVITIPLALLKFSFWSIIIGNITGNLVSAIVLGIISKIKLSIYFDIDSFKEMLSFSFWSLIESIGTWLTSYIGTFIVGIYLNTYYLGLYKTTMTSINGIFAIITSATTAVLFSTLSRLQKNRNEYNKTYLEFINIVSIVIIPIGFGIFAYSDFVTKILLGEQWLEVIPFVGIYALMCSFTLVLGQYCSEYFRGIGKPKYNVLMNFLHLIVLIPVLIITSKKGFEYLTFWRSIVKVEQIAVYWFILLLFCELNPLKLLKSTWKSIVCSLLMLILAFGLRAISTNFLFELLSVVLCIAVYFVIYNYVLDGKKETKNMFYMFMGKGDKVYEE